MTFRQCVLLTTVLALVSLTPISAYAARFWQFRITVDGKPAFSGGIGMSDQTPPIEVLRTGLKNAGIHLGTDSSLDGKTVGDVTLTGDVVFQFVELPELRLEQLRLIYRPGSPQSKERLFVAGGFFDWKLHPDDADRIIAHYAATAPARPNGGSWLLSGLLISAGVVAVGVAFVRRRIFKARHVKPA